MFDLIGRIIEFFYSLTASYGLSILLLTLLVMLVVAPLTFKSTKSMIEMRRIQPQIKKIQTKYSADREKMNQELMQLYQKHGVNPVGGCLPVLVQAPVFFVLFRVVQGLTRRLVDTGYAAGNILSQGGLVEAEVAREVAVGLDEAPRPNFNPEYVSIDSDMYNDLTSSNEMLSWGIDLSRSASEVIRDSIPDALPYLLMVVATGVLSWYQQRQIQGRTDAEIPQQMRAITKIMPWLAPLFAFTLPAALGVYFIGSALFRVVQNFIITQRYYSGEEDVIDEPLDDDDWEAPEGATPAPDPANGPLGALFGGGANADGERGTGGSRAAAAPAARHGSRRPVSSSSSARKRVRPPRDGENSGPSSNGSATSTTGSGSSKGGGSKGGGSKGSGSKGGGKGGSARNGAGTGTDAGEGGGSLWSRARRSAEARERGERPGRSGSSGGTSGGSADNRQSRRVTPKGTRNPKQR